MALQVDPIDPTLKAPESERLKVKCGDLFSYFAFNFDLRRYNEGDATCTHCGNLYSSNHDNTRWGAAP